MKSKTVSIRWAKNIKLLFSLHRFDYGFGRRKVKKKTGLRIESIRNNRFDR